MTVEAIRLLNFMAFEDTDWIELKPITLLFGRNSSGKSAIIRALRLLKQSLKADASTGPLRFLRRMGIDQGAFSNTVHRKPDDEENTERYMIFCFRCNMAGEELIGELRHTINAVRGKNGLNEISADAPDKWLEVSVGFSMVQKQGETQKEDEIFPVLLRVESPWILAEAQKRTTIFAIEKLMTADFKALELRDEQWLFWSEVFLNEKRAFWPALELKKDDNGFWPRFVKFEELTETKKTVSDSGKIEEYVHPARQDYELLQDLLDSCKSMVTEFLGNIVHLGPLRPESQRVYALDKLEELDWQERGLSDYLDFLMNTPVVTGFAENLQKWIDKLDLGWDVVARNATGHPELPVASKVEIWETKSEKDENKPPFNLADVGSGMAQVLPILVTSLLAQQNRLVIIEQPELHLHPRAQAELGDLFIQNIEREVRFLIETHSEHLILRLQRRIRKSVFPPSKLFVIYAMRDKGRMNSRMTVLRVDKEGDFIDRWPEGFFEEGYLEVFDITDEDGRSSGKIREDVLK